MKLDKELDAMVPRYARIPVSYSVYALGENPLAFQATKVSLVDEMGGPFLELTQDEDTFRIDLAEWRLLVSCVQDLLAAYPDRGKIND